MQDHTQIDYETFIRKAHALRTEAIADTMRSLFAFRIRRRKSAASPVPG
jgi:hypothetical protein